MDEQPDDDAYTETTTKDATNHLQMFIFGSSPPASTADAATTELDDSKDDPNDEVWHEASEGSEDEQDHQ
ncbi:uncharacterized protein N7515_004028 [Penicillium bovifimosum]|uniref:Uncharacterized protein n=1 Tax=Penicillium bovifimosum TaxID=126998 RepID=A0A9W9H5S5_9EURO|nr:uncharacterized protein N7515_004028 [Penicillium bovifimosum]KAJ5139180.1 hypothetical protein N7515_004028 [Penicillium bovifimosum]